MDTQEKVAKLMESDSYMGNTSSKVEKLSVGRQRNGSPSYVKDIVPRSTWERRSGPGFIESTTDRTLLVSAGYRQK